MGIVLTDDSVVQLHSLVIGPEDDGVREVGRPETGVFIALPPEGVELLSWLDGGTTLTEVRDRFASAHGIAPELVEFVGDLVDCGFVKAIDGAAAGADAAAESPAAGWHLLAALPQRRVAWLLGRPMRLLYFGVWLAVPVLLALRPDLIPRAASALLYPEAGINALLLAVFAWTLWLLHELAHLLAARARGCIGALSMHPLSWAMCFISIIGIVGFSSNSSSHPSYWAMSLSERHSMQGQPSCSKFRAEQISPCMRQ